MSISYNPRARQRVRGSSDQRVFARLRIYEANHSPVLQLVLPSAKAHIDSQQFGFGDILSVRIFMPAVDESLGNSVRANFRPLCLLFEHNSSQAQDCFFTFVLG
jgi:hypothetical protein